MSLKQRKTSNPNVSVCRMNPSAVENENRNVELARLRESNDKLRERVRVLESAGASGSSSLNTTAVVEEHLKIQGNKELHGKNVHQLNVASWF